jgi:hypothetical protein
MYKVNRNAGEVFLLRVSQWIAELLWEPTQINHKQENKREERGRTKSQMKINTNTCAIYFLRFGAKEPTPCWGVHVGQVPFNPFHLSKGHLDLSSSSQSRGSLRPRKDHHTLRCLLLAYMWVRIRRVKKKARSRKPSNKSNKRTQGHTLSRVSPRR